MSSQTNTFLNMEYREDLCDEANLANCEIGHPMRPNFAIFPHFVLSKMNPNWINQFYNTIYEVKYKKFTDFDTRAHVFFKRKMALFVKAAQICKTPLKLCKHRQISATAAHFSIAWTRVVTQGCVKISDTTKREVWK